MKTPAYLILLFGLFYFTFNSLEGNAQDVKLDPKITFSSGYSYKSVKFLGKTPDSQTQMYSLGYQAPIKTLSNGLELWYTASIVPYLQFDYPKRDEDGRRTVRTGFGISPLGYRMYLKQWYAFTPFIETTGGLIYMDDYFPTDNARRLNYTFDITLGSSLSVTDLLSLSFGYKFHHISNAETGSENPGLDSNFLFITISTP